MAFDIGTIQGSVKLTYDSKGLNNLDRDMKKADKSVGRLEKSSSRLGEKMRTGLRTGAMVAGTAIGVGLVAATKKSITAASDLDESINKSNATFEKAGKTVLQWSTTSAKAMGMSRSAALEGAASIGAMLKPMGVAPQQAAKMSMSMAQLAADMGSFNNQDPTEMLDRIRAGLSGESEPLKQFGTVLSETRVKAFAWAEGIAKSGEELTEQQKIMARYGLLLKDTKDQQGDFGRTSKGLANQERILKASLEDVAASLGQVLLPEVTRLANWITGKAVPALQKLVNEFKNNKGTGGEIRKVLSSLVKTMRDLAPTVISVATFIGRLVKSFSTLSTPVKTAIAAFAAFLTIGLKLAAFFRVAPLMMGPVGIAIGIIGMAAVLLIKHWDSVKKFLGNIWTSLKNNFMKVASTISSLARKGFLGPLPLIISRWKDILSFVREIPGKIRSFLSSVGKIVLAPFKWAGDKIKSVFDSVVNAVRSAIDKVKSLFGSVSGVIGKVGSFVSSAVPLLSQGGKAGPGAGGIAIVGEGNKDEFVISQEGDRRKNQALLLEAASALGVPMFAKGGVMKGKATRVSQKIENMRQNMNLKRREFELSGGQITAGEFDRLINLNKNIETEIKKLISATRGQDRVNARFALREAQMDRRDLLREKNSLKKSTAPSETPNLDFQIQELETNLALAESGYGSGDPASIRDQIRKKLEGKLALLRERLKKASSREQAEALMEAIQSTISSLAGLKDGASSGSEGPSLIEQTAAASQLRFEALSSFGSNAMQMGLGSGGRSLARAGQTNVYLNGEFKLNSDDPHSSVRNLGYQLANNL